ncbi:ParB N-terminal domain-containing protein [uncultured Draconibacterium sp.]|uniref:ParB N-terminal domain-containing protein n=1 Tax=uncultured Draconibacterium sp. TaxID=1573823 RepID=UPI0029C99A84|nr:ParB N-terminal domain-containing protein [uncultured Draconibacterium sp.]
MTNIEFKNLKDIKLDFRNPRLSEFGINDRVTEPEILTILWDEMAVDELMYSIVSNGFWDYEPLIVIQEGGEFIAIEGNRRLAAVKLIHNPSTIERKIPAHITRQITEELLEQTSNLPVIIVKTREDSWRFVGFKHVNGPAKWGSFAKAKYIAEIHNEFNVPINEIAYQIGDTNNTAQKLYQGLMVLEQANRTKTYKYDDIQTSRIYFSHLYTGLQREGIRNFLNIKDVEDEAEDPVPKDRLQNLGEVLQWLYGSKKNEVQPVIKSQNPDLKYLDEVLQSAEATYALRAGESLSYAHELSRSSDALFEENLLATKRSLQKARAHLTTGYKGEESLLKVAGSVADLADDLYREMERVYQKQRGNERKSRMSE